MKAGKPVFIDIKREHGLGRENASAAGGLPAAFLFRRGAAGSAFGILVDLGLLVLCALALSRLIWVGISPSAFVEAPKAATGPSGAAAIRLQSDPQVFVRFNPFDRGLTQSEPVTEDAPQTTLNLVIRSLISSTAEGESVVRIERPDGTGGRFKAGDTIVTDVTLERILSDRVILLRNGEREILFAKEAKVLGVVTPEGAPVIDPTPRTTVSGPIVPRQSVFSISSQQAEELFRGVAIARLPDPSGTDGTLLQITSGSEVSMLAPTGLKVGDYLLSVNGLDLREQAIAEIANDLQSADRLEFRIIRSGAETNINIQIDR